MKVEHFFCDACGAEIGQDVEKVNFVAVELRQGPFGREEILHGHLCQRCEVKIRTIFESSRRIQSVAK